MEPTPTHAPITLRGFTLVEMVVVLGIIIIITSIALLGQSSFNRSVILSDVSYTIAFSIREAQSLGLSSRAYNSVQDAGYGVHFTSGITSYYELFADTWPAESAGNVHDATVCPGHLSTTHQRERKPGDCMWKDATETVRRYTLPNNFKIVSFCGTDVSANTERCDGYLDALDIVYLRPNTQSIINGIRNGGGNTKTRIALSDARITVSSPDGAVTRCVLVSKVGQVSVVNKGDPGCP